MNILCGDWKIEDGMLKQTSTDYDYDDPTGMLFFDGTYAQDYTFEFDIVLDDHMEITIPFGVTDDANYYFCWLGYYRKRFNLVKVTDGERSDMENDQPPTPMDEGQVYHFKGSLLGEHFCCWLDDEMLYSGKISGE
jgi:hypothetical protein